MSKPVAKTQKVTIEEEQSSKITFENAPKLFSKWSYDDIKVPHCQHRSKTPVLLTTLLPSLLKLKSLCLILLADIRQRSSEKHFAPSLSDLLAHSNSTAGTLVKRPKQSES